MDAPKARFDEILKRVEELETHLKQLKSGLEEIKDMQLMEKLDMVNLKNEVERVEMANPEIAKQNDDARSIQELRIELDQIRQQLSAGRLNVCKNCGSVVESGSKYCGNCGGKV